MDATHRNIGIRLFREAENAETDRDYWLGRAKYLAFLASNVGWSGIMVGADKTMYAHAEECHRKAENGTPRDDRKRSNQTDPLADGTSDPRPAARG